MTTPVEKGSRKQLRCQESDVPNNNKKAKLGHRHVTKEAEHTLELCTPYKLLDFAMRSPRTPVGSLVELSTILGEGASAIVGKQYLIWKELSVEISKLDRVVNQNIKISAFNHTTNIDKFLKDDQIVFPTVFLDIDIKVDGAPADNGNTTYEIAVLATDYFQRLKTVEDSLPSILLPPLRHLVRDYIS